MSSYYYLHADKNKHNASFIEDVITFAEKNQTLIYILDKPLTDQKYNYSYKSGLILLAPKCKITIIDFGKGKEDFLDFYEDVIEDIGSISDKYLYKNVIGRTRKWKESLVHKISDLNSILSSDQLFQDIKLEGEAEQKKIELLISLFIGSINDIERVKADIPVTLLDKVKQKIQLFDGDQTRFVYQPSKSKKIRIQGLSGTGKTELLLHKLKDIYISEPSSKIFFTCHNKILADSLEKRIPDFFNFMKVEQQIEWRERLWCTNAWGSESKVNSGAYRYICAFYKIPFYHFSFRMSFSKACEMAYEDILKKYKDLAPPFALTHMFIDESQDFDENFFKLCELVTEKNVYIAGDIFQSIFDETISSTIEPDFLLGKCYRTDPKTLMFAHGLGMGLFESSKLRWLEEKEWKDCGYNVQIENNKYHLSREPSRRFEDLNSDFESIRIVEIENTFSDTVINIIAEIQQENSTVEPEDIGIILLDSSKEIYKLADILEFKIKKEFGWQINKAYDSKKKVPQTVLISNRNNVKGLEFPFVICVTKKITTSPSYRNSLYTMLSRSFIKSYFLTQSNTQSGLTTQMKQGLDNIIKEKQMIIEEPTQDEKVAIQTRFKYSLKKLSHYDLMQKIFKELDIDPSLHEKLINLTQQLNLITSDQSTLKEFIKDNMKYVN